MSLLRRRMMMQQNQSNEITMGDMVSSSGYAYKWYTDDGITPYTESITTRGVIHAITSEKTFENDTKLSITLEFDVQVYDCFTFSSSEDAVNYHVVKVGDEKWVPSLKKEIEYTVRKGNRLRITSYASPFENATVTVKKV